MEEFDGAIPIPTIIPRKVLTWVQIHRIPPLYRTESIITQLVEKVGSVAKVELNAVSSGLGDFHRAKVGIESSKPLGEETSRHGEYVSWGNCCGGTSTTSIVCITEGQEVE